MSESCPYIDIQWISWHGGLSKENILNYFYTSPFYDSSSDNQVIMTQGISYSFLESMTGIQYIIDEQTLNPPELFVIKKIKRKGERKNFDLLHVYYCLDGTIYMSPSFLDLLRSRVMKGSYYLLQSFNELGQHMAYTDKGQVLCSDTNASEEPLTDEMDINHPNMTDDRDNGSIHSHSTGTTVNNSQRHQRQQSHAKFLIRGLPSMKTVFANLESASFWTEQTHGATGSQSDKNH